MFLFLLMHICIFCLMQKGEKDFVYERYERRGEEFGEFMHVYLLVYAYICLVLCTLLNIFIFIVMHELRGSFMKLNFNPCIYNSMSFVIIKKGEIVGLRPIT